MAQHKELYGEFGYDAKLIAYQNAYRLKKKGLLSEIERSLRVRRESAPEISED